MYDSSIYLGTFCEDGTYSLPVGHDLNLGSKVTIIPYGIPSLTQTKFTVTITHTMIHGLINHCNSDKRHSVSHFYKLHHTLVFVWFHNYKIEQQTCSVHVSPDVSKHLLLHSQTIPLEHKWNYSRIYNSYINILYNVTTFPIPNFNSFLVKTLYTELFHSIDCKSSHKEIISTSITLEMTMCYECCDSITYVSLVPQHRKCSVPTNTLPGYLPIETYHFKAFTERELDTFQNVQVAVIAVVCLFFYIQ